MKNTASNYGKGSKSDDRDSGKSPGAKSLSNYPTASPDSSKDREDMNASYAQASEEADDTTLSDPEIAADNNDLDQLLVELDGLVGLGRVKAEVRRLIDYVRVQDLRREHGISEPSMSLHSVFYGSPGTGKTTVARVYGRMLKALSLLYSGHLVETDRAGLVANYVGQTATKTDKLIRAALGGILFIDEAYSLARGDGSSRDYGSEAIEILVKRMEDHRSDFVIIVAGYPDPMKKFLRSNEGFMSRFSTYIHFDDFSPQELLEIFVRFCQTEHYELTEEATDLVFTSMDYNYSLRDKTFGNARFARNLFEVVIKNHAARVAATITDPSTAQLKLLVPEDIPLTTDMGQN